MKIEDIAKLHHLVEVHIRLSDAIVTANDKQPLLNIQGKVVEEMQKVTNPKLSISVDPRKIRVMKIPVEQESKPFRRRTRGLGIR